MPLPETVEIIDRLSALESTVTHLTHHIEDMAVDMKTLTASYNQAQGAKALGYAIAGFVGFVFANGKAIGLGMIGMLK